MMLLKKKLYNKLTQQKILYKLHTYNRTINKFNDIEKNKIYSIYLLLPEKNNIYIKEISGLLIKKNKMQNLTNLHLLSLKKYNNIYLSFFKESPNILIKYNINI